ncbi:lytic transglycosylase domain-containing protein [Aminobacter sp. AP02]|uniref:lytic transglycosylase domain-containing protein n=1 Tax=Aminobacter sp. AP02 TaxID=2135737 RepID=UPI000D7A035D|nr:lytic transglycosylase domain-containing protein [Aminobacter sp. AP02]PWK72640.1 soluble lytic murein transglycosylase-like protein [Aminobacter sp. AP02]
MPAIKTHLLISAALATALLSGCQTNTAALSTDLSTGADVALASEIDLSLPDTVAVVPTSYAGTDTPLAGTALAAAAAAEATQTLAAEAPAQAAVAAAAKAEAPAVPTAKAEAPAVAAADAAKAPAVAVTTPVPETAAPAVATAAAKAPLDPLDAPMAGGEIIIAANAPKLFGKFPPAPTIADYALPATAPVPASFQVASLGDVAPESFTPSSYAVPDSPALVSRGKIDQLIAKYAALYEVPESFVRRVVNRESTFNPLAYNKGHWGLMQIKHATARGMGYDGPANGLLDAETNLKFAVKYLRGAWMVADGNEDQADKLYQSGYYYHAKRKGLLDETGLGRDRVRHRG